MEPQFRFCKSADGTRIAYAVYGSGPPLIYVRSFTNGMHDLFTLPVTRAHLDAFAARTMLITFDRRGTGASARDVEDLSIESDAADIAAVADAIGLHAFTLLAEGSALTPCTRYAIGYRDRVARLVLWPGFPSDYRYSAQMVRADWSYARRVFAGAIYPDGPVTLQRAFSAGMRSALSAEMAARYQEMLADVDNDALLAAVPVPTLVLQRHQPDNLRQFAMRVAALVPDSQLRLVAGSAGTVYPEHEPVVAAIFEFMELGASASPEARGTAIILFADIVDSTALTESLGDAAFRSRARALDDRLRAIIEEQAGKAIDGVLVGDGVLALFTSANDAIAAARSCATAGSDLGLQLHLGLHAGDVIREQNNVYGGAVNIASRISGLSAPGEVLVSRTVADLARTSAGVTFEDRGEHELKGVADPVRVFVVTARDRA